jgi:hypothetical protein
LLSLPAFCWWPEALTPPTHSRFEKLNGHAKGAAGMIGLFKNPY